jgi:hypothetical protein
MQLTVRDGNEYPTSGFVGLSSGPHWFYNDDGRVLLIVRSSSSGTFTVESRGEAKCSHGFPHPIAQAVEADDVYALGPFSREIHEDAEGRVWFDYSGGGTDEALAIRLSPPGPLIGEAP